MSTTGLLIDLECIRFEFKIRMQGQQYEVFGPYTTNHINVLLHKLIYQL